MGRGGMMQVSTSGHGGFGSNGSQSPMGSTGVSSPNRRIVLGPETQRALSSSQRRLKQRQSSSSTPTRMGSGNNGNGPRQFEGSSPNHQGQASSNSNNNSHQKVSLWRRMMGRCAEDSGTMYVGDDISGPTDFRHHYHGTFDSSNIKFSGLPSEWTNQVKVYQKQFGVPLRSVPRLEVPGYPSRIPAILVVLKQELLTHNGLAIEGVFRVSANKETQEMYRHQLDHGQFQGCMRQEDAMCMAALIKEWFRALPQPLLNCLSRDTIVSTPKMDNTSEAASSLLLQLPDSERSIFLWLLDLLAEAAALESQNRMGVKALSIVLAPNLYTVPDGSSPMEVMALMDAAVNTVQLCLEERIKVTKQTLMYN